MNRIYHVLNELIPADDVAAMLGGADSPWAGRPLQGEMKEVTPLLRSVNFNTAGSSTTVSLIGDDTAQTLYLAIEGDDPAEVRALGQAAEIRLPVASLDELLREAADRYRAEPYRLIRLALGTTAIPHPEVLALFKRADTDANPAVRKAAINALGLTQWVEAFDPLEDRAANDPEPELREFAHRTLYSLRRALGMEQ
jgi:hypothetical protein